MGKMDKAASIAIEDIVYASAVTVSVTDLNFLKPIRNGDIFTIYTQIAKIGNTSITVNVSVMVRCKKSHEEYSVSNAMFTFVTIGEDSKPISVKGVLREDVPTYVRELVK